LFENSARHNSLILFGHEVNRHSDQVPRREPPKFNVNMISNSDM
jgi:hypothetical protein